VELDNQDNPAKLYLYKQKVISKYFAFTSVKKGGNTAIVSAKLFCSAKVRTFITLPEPGNRFKSGL